MDNILTIKTIKYMNSDEIRTGPYRSLFHPNQIISAKEDASNCYARGYYTLGREMLDRVLDNVRKQVECCECIQSFFVFHSFGGGTGSGFSALLLDHIASEFTSKSRLACAVYPSPRVGEKFSKFWLSLLGPKSGFFGMFAGQAKLCIFGFRFRMVKSV